MRRLRGLNTGPTGYAGKTDNTGFTTSRSPSEISTIDEFATILSISTTRTKAGSSSTADTVSSGTPATDKNRGFI